MHKHNLLPIFLLSNPPNQPLKTRDRVLVELVAVDEEGAAKVFKEIHRDECGYGFEGLEHREDCAVAGGEVNSVIRLAIQFKDDGGVGEGGTPVVFDVVGEIVSKAVWHCDAGLKPKEELDDILIPAFDRC